MILDEATGRVLCAITGLVRGYLSQSSKLYGVLEASEHSFYAFLNRFGAVCSKISGVQKPLRPVMLPKQQRQHTNPGLESNLRGSGHHRKNQKCQVIRGPLAVDPGSKLNSFCSGNSCDPNNSPLISGGRRHFQAGVLKVCRS